LLGVALFCAWRRADGSLRCRAGWPPWP